MSIRDVWDVAGFGSDWIYGFREKEQRGRLKRERNNIGDYGVQTLLNHMATLVPQVSISGRD